LVNFVLLLLYAFREGEVSLGALRAWLLEVLASFPRNVIIFLLFVQLEDRYGLSHRVRSYWEATWEGGEAAAASKAAAAVGPGPSLVLVMVRFELRRQCCPRALTILERALQVRELFRPHRSRRPASPLHLTYACHYTCPWSTFYQLHPM
jgi:hypothetical protein